LHLNPSPNITKRSGRDKAIGVRSLLVTILTSNRPSRKVIFYRIIAILNKESTTLSNKWCFLLLDLKQNRDWTRELNKGCLLKVVRMFSPSELEEIIQPLLKNKNFIKSNPKASLILTVSITKDLIPKHKCMISDLFLRKRVIMIIF
jgi:hypothetical protein